MVWCGGVVCGVVWCGRHLPVRISNVPMGVEIESRDVGLGLLIVRWGGAGSTDREMGRGGVYYRNMRWGLLIVR